MNHKSDSSLSAFFTGAVVGAIIALTLGTKEGRRLARRVTKNLKHFSEDLAPRLQDMAQKASSQVEHFTSPPPPPRPPSPLPLPPPAPPSPKTASPSPKPLVLFSPPASRKIVPTTSSLASS